MMIPFFLGCGSDDGTGEDDLQTGKSFVRLSISGPSLNGTFDINANGDDPGIIIAGIGIPYETGQLLQLSYFDQDKLLGFGMRISAKIGETEVLAGNPNGFEVAFTTSDLSLHELTTSVSVTDVKVDGFHLEQVKGTITGMVQFTYFDQAGEEVNEPHTMDGEFQYHGDMNTRD